MTYQGLVPSLVLLAFSLALRYGFGRRSRIEAPATTACDAAVVASLCLAVIEAFTLERSPPIWDSETYVRMASKGRLLAGGMAPFCFRILVPAVARAIPAPLPLSFELINQASLFAAGTLAYQILKARGLSRDASLVGVCVIILSSFTKFVVWYRYGVDQLALVGILAVSLALIERRFRLAGLLATVSALGKESIVLLIPFSYGELLALPRFHKRPVRAAGATLLLWSGPIIVLVLLRTLIPHSPGYGIATMIITLAHARLTSPKGYCELLLALPKTFGVIPLFWLLVPRRTWATIRSEPYAGLTVVTFCLAGIFGASDYERVYFLAAPLVLLVSLKTFGATLATPKQVAALVCAHLSLLDVLSPADFMNLRRWFMTNTEWVDLAHYATKVLIWTVILGFMGLGRSKA